MSEQPPFDPDDMARIAGLDPSLFAPTPKTSREYDPADPRTVAYLLGSGEAVSTYIAGLMVREKLDASIAKGFAEIPAADHAGLQFAVNQMVQGIEGVDPALMSSSTTMTPIVHQLAHLRGMGRAGAQLTEPGIDASAMETQEELVGFILGVSNGSAVLSSAAIKARLDGNSEEEVARKMISLPVIIASIDVAAMPEIQISGAGYKFLEQEAHLPEVFGIRSAVRRLKEANELNRETLPRQLLPKSAI